MKKIHLLTIAFYYIMQVNIVAQPKSAAPNPMATSYDAGYYATNTGSNAVTIKNPGRPAVPIGNAFAAGWATYYAHSYSGRLTSSGEVFDASAKTAAHRYLPIGTMVSVINLNNQKEVVVRINDRGPFLYGSNNIIDLSFGAAQEIGMINPGVVPVRIYVLSPVPDYVSRVPKDFEAWAIQVSSSKERVLAEKALAKLGHQATIRSYRTAQGVIMYRVLYGKYNRKEDAILAKEQLIAMGYPNSFEKYLVDDHPDLAGIK